MKRTAPKPCQIPTDPEQRLDITCAHCGTKIDFRLGEVFVNGPSYVCRRHVKRQALISAIARSMPDEYPEKMAEVFAEGEGSLDVDSKE